MQLPLSVRSKASTSLDSLFTWSLRASVYLDILISVQALLLLTQVLIKDTYVVKLVDKELSVELVGLDVIYKIFRTCNFRKFVVFDDSSRAKLVWMHVDERTPNMDAVVCTPTFLALRANIYHERKRHVILANANSLTCWRLVSMIIFTSIVIQCLKEPGHYAGKQSKQSVEKCIGVDRREQIRTIILCFHRKIVNDWGKISAHKKLLF